MFPVGGVPAMLAGIIVSGLLCLLVHLVLRRRLGGFGSAAWALLVWSVIGLALVTLLPAQGAPGVVLADERLGTCSFDLGGPAPEGFWIFSGGQRLLNTAIFVPSGVLLVLVAARWRSAWVTVPIGLAGLAAYSAAIEVTQLALARLDRACDVTDVVDNTAGAAMGVAIGIPLALILRPWRYRRPRAGRVG